MWKVWYVQRKAILLIVQALINNNIITPKAGFIGYINIFVVFYRRTAAKIKLLNNFVIINYYIRLLTTADAWLYVAGAADA